MTKYIVNYLYGEKDPNTMTEEQVLAHVDHLKSLDKSAKLFLCGVFTDESGAVLILNAESYKEAESFILQDPLIKEKFYIFNIKEIIEANNENNWLLDYE